MRRTVAEATAWRSTTPTRRQRVPFPRESRESRSAQRLPVLGQSSESEGGVGMRALALYMLGVPAFVIVILWLFGIV